ncbi:MAG: hypothetical protein ACN6PJ_04925 [Achromobacter sp.]|uniref:hypothetical protein n=1 Tax=Achromobacter sp. TaxID=134375 RepID=UPI003D03B7EE
MSRTPLFLVRTLILPALLACGAAQASAECPEAAGIVSMAYRGSTAPDAQGHIRLPDGSGVIELSNADYGAPFSVTCKAWPANPDLLLAAVPLMQDGPDPNDGHEGDLDVLVLDRQTLQVRQQLRLPDLMSDDAVRITQVSFDTARYDVAPGQRAFGIRIDREGASRANPFAQTSLRLFTINGTELDLVLDGLIVNSSSGEWDTNCAGEFNERAVSLAMGGAQGQGYRDIIATESHSASRAAPQDGDCVERPINKGRTRHTLRFDGEQYRIPGPLRAMDATPAG